MQMPTFNFDELVKSHPNGWHCKEAKFKAREARGVRRTLCTPQRQRDEAQRRNWTVYKAINFRNEGADLYRRVLWAACAGVLIALSPLTAFAAPDNLRETAVVRAVRKVSPAVVNISSAYEARARANPFSGFGSSSTSSSGTSSTRVSSSASSRPASGRGSSSTATEASSSPMPTSSKGPAPSR